MVVSLVTVSNEGVIIFDLCPLRIHSSKKSKNENIRNPPSMRAPKSGRPRLEQSIRLFIFLLGFFAFLILF